MYRVHLVLNFSKFFQLRILYPYWPDCLMFSKSLATIHFHFVLDLTLLLLHIDLNCLTISSPHYCGGFWSLRYHSTTVWVHLLSVNFVTCPLLNYLASDVLTQWYSQYGSFHSPLCITNIFNFFFKQIAMILTKSFFFFSKSHLLGGNNINILFFWHIM